MKMIENEIHKNILKNLKRVVIKIGSSVISRRERKAVSQGPGLCMDRVRHYSAKIKKVVANGCEVVLVSSGAIMAGRERLGITRNTLSIPEKQACAAIGQSNLMRAYEKKFERQGLQVAQILLSSGDLVNRQRYLNAKHTIETLLKHRVIPIINENDSVTVDEIKIGDNDTLSATVACLVDAQLLIILSDVEGLYSRDPSRAARGKSDPPQLIPLVRRVTPEVEKQAGKSKTLFTVGGMYTKVLAAKKTMSFGIPTLIVNGLDEGVMDKIFSGERVGTLFWSGKERIRNRKHWIAHTLKPMGTITVDRGAQKALVEGRKSLLSAGVIRVEGKFDFGNSVSVVDEKSSEIARGLVNYSSSDLEKIMGMKTSEVKKLFGSNYYEEVIHRDDMVVFY